MNDSAEIHALDYTAEPVKALDDGLQGPQKGKPVGIVFINALARAAATGHVVDRTGVLDPKGPGHFAKVPRWNSHFQIWPNFSCF